MNEILKWEKHDKKKREQHDKRKFKALKIYVHKILNYVNLYYFKNSWNYKYFDTLK